jgi:hypothetical protein
LVVAQGRCSSGRKRTRQAASRPQRASTLGSPPSARPARGRSPIDAAQRAAPRPTSATEFLAGRAQRHHLDLIAHLPSAAEPPAETLAAARASLERIAGAPLPASFADKDALLVGTGRRTPTDAEKAALGVLAAKIPLMLC